MTEIEFDNLITRFLWRNPAEMPFREVARAFSIAEHTWDMIVNELERRFEIDILHDGVPFATPESRDVESPISDGSYMRYRVPPMSEEEVEAHLQFVFDEPLGTMDEEALVHLLSAATGARNRIANALDARGMLFTKNPGFVDAHGADHPLSKFARTEYPRMPFAIPPSLQVASPLTCDEDRRDLTR